MKNALELAEQFCVCFFRNKDIDGAIAAFDENAQVRVEARNVCGTGEMRRWLEREIALSGKTCGVEFTNEQLIDVGGGASTALFSICLQADGAEIYAKIMACAGVKNGEPRLLVLNADSCNYTRSSGASLNEAIISMRDELLTNLLVGGVKGILLEKGHPVYYVNQGMLDVLGYASEAELVKATGGETDTLIHPDDMENTLAAVYEQLEKSGKFTVEYRAQKRDGNYIWLRDVGKKHITETGRDSVISVCYDITEEHENDELLDAIMTTINGGVATYSMKNGRFVPEYVSPGVSRLLGMTADEYKAMYADNIAPSVYTEDAPLLRNAVEKALRENVVTTLTYRSPHKNGEYVWINGVFVAMSAGGKAMLQAIFTPASRQFESQMNIIDLTATGIFVIDRDTFELYYTNKSGFTVLGAEKCEYVGRTCYNVMRGLNAPCTHCVLHKALNKSEGMEFYDPITGRTHIARVQNIDWYGKSAIIEYLTDITDRKNIETRLSRSYEMIEAASDYAGMWIWLYDIENNRAQCFSKLQREMGLPEFLENYPEQFLNDYGYEESDYVAYMECIESIRRGEARSEAVCRPIYADGKHHWLRMRFNLIPEKEGAARYAICTAIVIDSEKELEARINLEQQKPFANQDALLGYVVSNVTKNTIVHQQSLKGSLQDINIRSTRSRAVNDAIAMIIGDESRREFSLAHDEKNLKDFYEKGGVTKELEFRRILSDGRLCWVKNTIDLLRDPVTGDLMMYEYSYDIDTEKKDQLAIASLVAEDIDYCVLVDTHTQMCHLVKSNDERTYRELWEQSNYQNAVRRLLYEAVYPEDRLDLSDYAKLEYIESILDTGETASVSYRVQLKSGETRRKRTLAFYLDKTKDAIVISRRDINDIFEYETRQREQLKRAADAANEANRAKSAFLAQMSHEIRTPMNAIIGMTKLAEDTAKDSQTMEYLQKIDQASDYLLGILNDVLDMSRIENKDFTLNMEWCSRAEQINSCLSMILPLMRAKNITFVGPDISIYDDVECLTDPLRTKQVLMNILNNAVKFTPRGGNITLSMRRALISDSRSVEEVKISDTGCGMSQEFLRRAFKPFEQERNPYSDVVQGTGLGLALVKSIVTSMGGEISVESELGKGSTFIYTMPFDFRKMERREAAPEEEVSLNSLKGSHVLLADDQPLNQEIGKRLLEKKEVIVDVAADGEIALSIFKNSGAHFYDAILMDIRMPHMDGLEATRAIRALDRPDAAKVPIIAMTANAYDEDVNMSREAGMNDHLAKPVDPMTLYKTLAREIGRRRE